MKGAAIALTLVGTGCEVCFQETHTPNPASGVLAVAHRDHATFVWHDADKKLFSGIIHSERPLDNVRPLPLELGNHPAASGTRSALIVRSDPTATSYAALLVTEAETRTIPLSLTGGIAFGFAVVFDGTRYQVFWRGEGNVLRVVSVDEDGGIGPDDVIELDPIAGAPIHATSDGAGSVIFVEGTASARVSRIETQTYSVVWTRTFPSLYPLVFPHGLGAVWLGEPLGFWIPTAAGPVKIAADGSAMTGPVAGETVEPLVPGANALLGLVVDPDRVGVEPLDQSRLLARVDPAGTLTTYDIPVVYADGRGRPAGTGDHVFVFQKSDELPAQLAVVRYSLDGVEQAREIVATDGPPVYERVCRDDM